MGWPSRSQPSKSAEPMLRSAAVTAAWATWAAILPRPMSRSVRTTMASFTGVLSRGSMRQRLQRQKMRFCGGTALILVVRGYSLWRAAYLAAGSPAWRAPRSSRSVHAQQAINASPSHDDRGIDGGVPGVVRAAWPGRDHRPCGRPAAGPDHRPGALRHGGPVRRPGPGDRSADEEAADQEAHRGAQADAHGLRAAGPDQPRSQRRLRLQRRRAVDQGHRWGGDHDRRHRRLGLPGHRRRDGPV